MNDILVIKAPYPMTKAAMKRAYDDILKQMESGLVILPAEFSLELCPKDVEVKFMDSEGNNPCPVDPVIIDKLCENPGYILSKEEIAIRMEKMEAKDGT